MILLKICVVLKMSQPKAPSVAAEAVASLSAEELVEPRRVVHCPPQRVTIA
jgi:hypothetical protein